MVDMASIDLSQATFLGFTIKDAFSALIVPILAVLTTLFYQDFQQGRERRMQLLRMLMSTRHIPADPAFNAAINLIPVEFNKVRPVMDAWRAYRDQVRFRPLPENSSTNDEQMKVKQTKLVTAIMDKLGIEYSEAEFQSDAYISDGFLLRDNIYIDSLLASRAAANAMAEVAEALKEQVAMMRGGPPPGTSAH